MGITTAQYTIADLNDPVQQGTPPAAPPTGMLWLDTSAAPPLLKRWTGAAWETVNDVDGKLEDLQGDLAGNIGTLEGLLMDADGRLTALGQALEDKADADMVVNLSTQLKQNVDNITAVISQVAKIEGNQAAADKVLAEYQLTFRIDAQGVTIGKSTSPFDVRIDNQRMSFRENGQEIAYISNQTLHIQEAEVEDQLKIGTYSLQRMEDGSLGLMVV